MENENGKRRWEKQTKTAKTIKNQNEILYTEFYRPKTVDSRWVFWPVLFSLSRGRGWCALVFFRQPTVCVCAYARTQYACARTVCSVTAEGGQWNIVEVVKNTKTSTPN